MLQANDDETDGRFTVRVPPGHAAIADTPGLFRALPVVPTSEQDALMWSCRSTVSGFGSSVDVVAPLPAGAAPRDRGGRARSLVHFDNVFRTLQTLPGVSCAEESLDCRAWGEPLFQPDDDGRCGNPRSLSVV